ncbi:V/A-type H+-transporting ATPase subunit I [Halogranum amylolyticum]|uniref:A-type ATP synthase subunit I n=1 Tax=Halogranum amylolyticum TaxID=660520 RepID=A0A1H8QKM5_9EURY|nr:V-type ATP synthase subunit I [Halogranum amylolyticum]SEO54363.1 V/A-type H+-transporting ATPase subunit I [Halogranum amylolyticum]
MLRPEQMSKVSVTGSKKFMDDVIETVHDLHLLDVTDYDGSWEQFQPGDPMEGAETASDKLVTVRSIESILDVDADDAGPSRIVTDDALEEELNDVRARVNELDDRRDELRTEIRDIDERIDAMSPFATLGIDLDLLSGYDSLQVEVGRGKHDAVDAALVRADEIEQYEIFGEGNVLAVFARPADSADEDALADALVGTEFATLEVPEADTSPEEYVDELRHRKQQFRSELDAVEDDLEELKLDAAGFLLAAEEKLSIDVQKTEAPLSFATTENAFVAEGWIPTTKFGEFASALDSEVGSHVEVEELERASFKSTGHESVREPVGDTGSGVAADGGTDVVMQKDDPPVVQNNPGVIKPFEVLVNAVGRPNYREFDPSIVLFLTFPAFFGFMIGDLGYGLVYAAIGYFLYANFDSQGIKSMGGVTIFAGIFTALFGILYGEIFGLHLISTYFWEGALGMSHAPMLKGLAPAEKDWALGWLTVSVLLGILHLNVGWIFDFVENLELHDLKHAMYESASWLLMMNGLWVWILSDVTKGTAPQFLFTTFSAEGVIPLGFNGFPAIVGWAGLALFAVGLGLLAVGEPAELPEFLNVLVNVLSYTRIAAVLLAKAGMAFTVNLLFFGAYSHNGEFHFMLDHGPQWVINEYGQEAIMFGGLMHGGAASIVGGLLVLVLGHLLVLVLGVTSAGLQTVRLEYVEFFGKFYDGGGREYTPFGYDRRYTTED